MVFGYFSAAIKSLRELQQKDFSHHITPVNGLSIIAKAILARI